MTKEAIFALRFADRWLYTWVPDLVAYLIGLLTVLFDQGPPQKFLHLRKYWSWKIRTTSIFRPLAISQPCIHIPYLWDGPGPRESERANEFQIRASIDKHQQFESMDFCRGSLKIQKIRRLLFYSYQPIRLYRTKTTFSRKPQELPPFSVDRRADYASSGNGGFLSSLPTFIVIWPPLHKPIRRFFIFPFNRSFLIGIYRFKLVYIFNFVTSEVI